MDKSNGRVVKVKTIKLGCECSGSIKQNNHISGIDKNNIFLIIMACQFCSCYFSLIVTLGINNLLLDQCFL